jgi:ParB/RepB/Spo0J family partition protein
MTSPILGNKYVEPDLRHIELSKFDIRREKEEYHKEQIEIDEEEADKFTSLVESIRDLGVLQPIYVIEHKDKTFEVVDGGRRLRAAKFLKLPTVPAMVFQGDINETEIRKRTLIANVQRKDFTLEEKGEGLAEYYKSGGVDPEHAISYLNTLRQRKQTKDQKEGGFVPEHSTNLGGRPKQNDPEEYERFLELHKKLGIARMTQYEWMTQVVFIPPEVRKSQEFKSLSSGDRRKITSSEVRNKPKVQKRMVKELSSIEKDFENAKQKRKKENVDWTVEELRVKERKQEKLREYLPNTYDKKPREPENPILYYGQINGHLSRIWNDLTLGKNMPISTDDVLNDFFKPTRKQFKEYINDLGGGERTQLYEWLTYVRQLIDDRLKLFG